MHMSRGEYESRRLDEGICHSGVPVGLLMHYILHRLKTGPAHGYQLLAAIENKTQKVWRPSPGSLYPMIKKMLKSGLISVKEVREGRRVKRLYSITPQGLLHLAKAKEAFLHASQRIAASRRLLVDIVDQEDIPAFIKEGAKIYLRYTYW